jgi:hypothetical protein
LDADMDRLLNRAAHDLRISRSEFIRSQLRRVLEQFREHPAPRSAGVVKSRIRERGIKADLFATADRAHRRATKHRGARERPRNAGGALQAGARRSKFLQYA